MILKKLKAWFRKILFLNKIRLSTYIMVDISSDYFLRSVPIHELVPGDGTSLLRFFPRHVYRCGGFQLRRQVLHFSGEYWLEIVKCSLMQIKLRKKDLHLKKNWFFFVFFIFFKVWQTAGIFSLKKVHCLFLFIWIKTKQKLGLDKGTPLYLLYWQQPL